MLNCRRPAADSESTRDNGEDFRVLSLIVSEFVVQKASTFNVRKKNLQKVLFLEFYRHFMMKETVDCKSGARNDVKMCKSK